jgi:hypothetical protein
MNRLLSRKALETSFTISIIAACTEVTGNFYEDRRRLYSENARQKNLGTYYTPCNVLPFTQVDRRTYQPIVKKQISISIQRKAFGRRRSLTA